MKTKISPGSYGVSLIDDDSPVYVVQRVNGGFVFVSSRFDDAPSEWLKLSTVDFWPLT